MFIEDKFHLANRGTIVTGRIERGRVEVGDRLEMLGFRDEVREVTVEDIEIYQKSLKAAIAGDNLGFNLSCGA